MSAAREKYLQLRRERVDLHVAIQRRLEYDGSLEDLLRKRDGELDAWMALNHDERMAVLDEDRREREALLARAAADEREGMDWWNGLSVSERATWLERSHGESAADAWMFFSRSQVHAGGAS